MLHYYKQVYGYYRLIIKQSINMFFCSFKRKDLHRNVLNPLLLGATWLTRGLSYQGILKCIQIVIWGQIGSLESQII